MEKRKMEGGFFALNHAQFVRIGDLQTRSEGYSDS
jgi:hypothetical protein